ncbi:MAG TPA: hypothetical protein VJX67_16350, partial [Blastocatellia bacterium]|nr:hypothetical protein [Blastocatellia bacterium]
MSGNYLAVQALGFATGSVLFAMLAILAWRAERNTVEPRYGTRAAALGFLWNLGSLIRYLGLLAGLPGSGLTVRLGSALAWCAIAILPTAVFLLLRRAAWGQTWRATASRYFRRLSCLIAAVLTLGFLLTAWSASMYVDLPVPGSAGPLSITFHTVMHLSAYNLVLHVIAGVVLTPGLPLHAAGKAYSKTVLLWMAGLGVLLMISIHGGLSPGVQSVMETATQQSTIPVAIISLVYLARFR